MAVLVLLATGQVGSGLGWGAEATLLWQVHVWSGYGLLTGLVARLTWGLIGPEHARWRALWQPSAWGEALRSRRFFVAPRAFGHHPVASMIYLAVYVGLILMLLTGLALAAIDRNTGPLYDWLGHAALAKPYFRTPHVWGLYPILGFVLVHLSALVLHRRLHGIPVAQAMVSGYQYLRRDTR